VRQLENKVLGIVDALCNHEVYWRVSMLWTFFSHRKLS